MLTEPLAKQDTSSLAIQEPVRPELNLEMWAIWFPAHSNVTLKLKTFERGNAKVEVSFYEGLFTTEDQKVYYALVKMWEEAGRPPTEPVLFSMQRLAKILKRAWSQNTLASLRASLKRLNKNGFEWTNSYIVENAPRQTLDLIESFQIVSNLKIARLREGSRITKEACSFQFNGYILQNLLNNHTRPVLLETVLSFKSEIAQMLYTRLDYLLYDDKNPACGFYTRNTTGLFEDLGLEGKDYHKLSVRKRRLEPALVELEGARLPSGVITYARMEPTKDGKDWKIVIRKGPVPRAKLPDLALAPPDAPKALPPPPASEPVPSEAQSLILYFCQKFTRVAPEMFDVKDLVPAKDWIARAGYPGACAMVDHARQKAQETNYKPRFFRGIVQYAAEAQAERKQDVVKTESRHARQRAQEAHRAAIIASLEQMYAQMQTEQPEAYAAFAAWYEKEQARVLKRYSEGNPTHTAMHTLYGSQSKRLEMFVTYFGKNACPLPELTEILQQHSRTAKPLNTLVRDHYGI